jgi:hypothetical protein
MFCDDCLVEPALIDHLDVSTGAARLRRLCKPCAEADLARWTRERLVGPTGFPAPTTDRDRRAA